MKNIYAARTVTFFLLVVTARLLSADVCEFDYLKAYSTFGLASANRCFGEDNDSSEITERLLERVNSLSQFDTDAELTAEGTKILDSIQSALLAEKANAPDDMKDLFRKMQDQISGASTNLRNEMNMDAERWRLNRDDYSFPELNIKLDPAFSQACPLSAAEVQIKPVEQCMRAYQAAKSLARYGSLTGATLFELVQILKILPEQEKVAEIDREWDAYFENGRSQYIWELALNSYLFDRQLGAECRREYAARQQPNESENEYCQRYTDSRLPLPPKGQWILLHPTAAVEYVDDDEMGDTEFNAVAIVDVVGYNRLSWDSSVLSNLAVGASIVATISPGSSGDSVGWGAMIHINNKYSIGAARRDLGNGTETTWLFTLDLGRYFLEKSQGVKDAFRGLD